MKLILALVLLSLTACSSMIGYNFSVGSKESVAKKITYKFDEFERSGWLETEMYMGSKAQPGTNYNFRANYTSNGTLNFIQVYAKTFNTNWCFIERINDANGKAYTFHQISRDVSSASGTVGISESYAFDITKSQLEQLATSNNKFKAIGSKCDSIFEIDQRVSSAFLDSLNQKEQD